MDPLLQPSVNQPIPPTHPSRLKNLAPLFISVLSGFGLFAALSGIIASQLLLKQAFVRACELEMTSTSPWSYRLAWILCHFDAFCLYLLGLSLLGFVLAWGLRRFKTP
jgi:hypothetical protein